ncbi:MAG: hypothetical protein FJ189_09300, partial [Gammaproteobacteria bacterium]|nr:hypothetical protein [Gammaproteobacteria bacterium]
MKTQPTTHRRFALPAGFLLACVASAASAVVIDPFSAGSSTAAAEQQTISHEALLTKVHERGTARVIVRLATPFQPEGVMHKRNEAGRQRARIASVRRQLLGSLLGYSPDSVKSFGHAPMLAFEVDALGLEMLSSSPLVAQFVEDKAMPPLLPQSVPLVGADEAWGTGFSGAGETVAILDTGIDPSHPFLAGKIVAEACFSTTYGPFGATTVCPNSRSAQSGGGAAVPCRAYGCDHGTHVAGIAAGRGAQFSGVARDARIIAVQVFSLISDSQICASFGYPTPCPAAFSSDVVKGLEYVYQLRNHMRIASVNLSLGSGRYTGHCDSEMPKPAIDNLRSVGIATVIASGNSGYGDALSFPACISSAVSVGASNKNDSIASFSNSAGILKLLAPGDGYQPFSGILSSTPGGRFQAKAGTSMAAPHVAGAWAVLKSVRPAATVDQVLGALTSGGRPLIDPRNGLSKPRIRVEKALALLAGWIDDDLVFDFGIPLGSYSWLSSKGFVSRIHALPTQQLAAADFDGNGRSDLALAFAAPYSGTWLWVNGVGWVRIHTLSARHLAAGDFNRDGRSDLA